MASSVSIVMVMKNERRNLERGFERVQGQNYDGPVEIVYVDSGSTDGTVEFMRERGIEAHVIPPQEFHHGRTRNLGASLAQHEILVFLSGDAVPVDERWLARLVAPFEDPRVGAVYGRQVPPPGMGRLRARALEIEYPDVRIVRDLATEPSLHPGLFRFSNANSAVRKELWEQFPFNEELTLAEDQGLCRDVLMAGYRVVYEPEAAVVHGHERSLFGEFKFAVDNGYSLMRMGILRNPLIGGETGYGLQRVRRELGYYVARREWADAARCFAVSAAKWLGVQVGKRGDRLPRPLMRRISSLR